MTELQQPAAACRGVATAQTGFSPDWEGIFDRYAAVVYSVPRRRGLPPSDCDDVAQATWLTALRKGGAPRDDPSLVRWLAAIAAWETRNLLRKKNPRSFEPGQFDDRPGEGVGIPERLAAEVEQHRIVLDALRALSERDRSLLEALFLRDAPMSYDEVASAFGVRIGSVGPLRLRALDRLRSELSLRGF